MTAPSPKGKPHEKFVVRTYQHDSDLQTGLRSYFEEGYVLAQLAMGFSYDWSLNNTQYRYTAVFVHDPRIEVKP